MMRRPSLRFACLSCAAIVHCAGAVLTVCPARAQDAPDERIGVPCTGNMGITETVDQIMARPAAPLLHPPLREHERPGFTKRPNPDSPATASWPLTGERPRPSPVVTDNPQIVGLNFQGAQYADAFYAVPDTVGAVGTTQIMVCSNGSIKTFTKTGSPGPLNTSSDSFFNSVRAGMATVDPQVRYDPISQRWFVSCITDASPNRICIAVSSGPVITNSSSFTFFQFQQDLVGTPGVDLGGFADYDSLGIDANAAYIGVNMFNPGFVGCTAFVVRKSSILGAGPIVVTAFRQIANGTIDGPDSPRGVSNDDPAATEGYFIGPSLHFFGRLAVRRILTPGGTPSLSSSLFITVPATTMPTNPTAMGGAFALDAIDDRCFQAAIRKNRYTGLSTLWTAHHFAVNASGVATTGSGRNGSRWYEIQNLTTTPALRQSGTFFDSNATNPRSYWMPSIIMSGQGHAAIATSFAGAADRAGAITAGRLGTDTLGATQAASVIINGVSTYNNSFGLENNAYRWGDYSATVVDPTDDQTIWTFQEYCNATNSWGIRVAKLVAPPPATPLSCSPAAVPPGANNFNVVITGSSVNGSSFYDTAPGLSRAQVQIGGTGVFVNSVSLISPTQLSMNITADPGAAATARTITVTNPDGQTAASATGILSIGAGGPLNDQCANLLPLFAGTTSFITTNATTDGPLEPGCGLGADPQVYNDIWYVHIATCTGTATADLCNSNYDTRIAVYEGVCPTGPGTAIACNDDACGTRSRVSWGTILNRTYTIRIGGGPGASGSGFISLSCGPCYANCDNSSIAPVLNVNDFVCFLNRFAAGDSRANCDNSTVPPVLNVNDFGCFLNRFAAGC